MDNVYEKSVILIGGMGIGKSTVSEVLSEKLNMAVVSCDAKKDEILMDLPDYSFEKQLQIRKELGYNSEVDFLIPYLELTLNNILDSLNSPVIVDTGALNTLKPSILSISKLKRFKNIILLRTNDLQYVLKRRKISLNGELSKIYIETHLNLNNEYLCTHSICVDGKTPEEIAQEIINIIYAIKKR